MTQKSNEEIYKALKEEERTLLEKNVGWLNKAFKLKENMQLLGDPMVRSPFVTGDIAPLLRDFRFLFSKMENRSQPTIGKLKMELRTFGFCTARKPTNLGKSSSALFSEEMYQSSLVMPKMLNRRLTMSF